MTRVEHDVDVCYDEDEEFDWETFQYLCDCADYWDCEE